MPGFSIPGSITSSGLWNGDVASTKQSFKIEGLAEVDKALIDFAEEYSPSKAKALLTRTLKKVGQPIADAEKSYAPKLTGKLAASPVVSTKLTRRQKRANTKESDVEVYIGPTPHAKSVQTEFGNAHQAPEPHLRPAWDGGWKKALDSLIAIFTAEIEKTRKRYVKKAEREAAKLKAGK